ncbi:hypothetical protein BGZ61DRAFT_592498 [Ilyonectria robusta]|uniref:uncharacterized protein n=1 Tax=Ilyonectria robusta TaxID=1079257 RepID=UPI001E8D8282|nr:uncharacterized protein BGZ61DRAFT_592498 [Ilyonectria robusta]KAH8667692.1 hypothetical protein BGZ61DRAFT_592498 [Ilyonectria robusta]
MEPSDHVAQRDDSQRSDTAAGRMDMAEVYRTLELYEKRSRASRPQEASDGLANNSIRLPKTGRQRPPPLSVTTPAQPSASSASTSTSHAPSSSVKPPKTRTPKPVPVVSITTAQPPSVSTATSVTKPNTLDKTTRDGNKTESLQTGTSRSHTSSAQHDTSSAQHDTSSAAKPRALGTAPKQVDIASTKAFVSNTSTADDAGIKDISWALSVVQNKEMPVNSDVLTTVEPAMVPPGTVPPGAASTVLQYNDNRTTSTTTNNSSTTKNTNNNYHGGETPSNTRSYPSFTSLGTSSLAVGFLIFLVVVLATYGVIGWFNWIMSPFQWGKDFLVGIWTSAVFWYEATGRDREATTTAKPYTEEPYTPFLVATPTKLVERPSELSELFLQVSKDYDEISEVAGVHRAPFRQDRQAMGKGLASLNSGPEAEWDEQLGQQTEEAECLRMGLQRLITSQANGGQNSAPSDWSALYRWWPWATPPSNTPRGRVRRFRQDVIDFLQRAVDHRSLILPDDSGTMEESTPFVTLFQDLAEGACWAITVNWPKVTRVLSIIDKPQRNLDVDQEDDNLVLYGWLAGAQDQFNRRIVPLADKARGVQGAFSIICSTARHTINKEEARRKAAHKDRKEMKKDLTTLRGNRARRDEDDVASQARTMLSIVEAFLSRVEKGYCKV